MKLDFEGPAIPVPILRFTVRRLMLGTAMLGLLLWGLVDIRRQRERERFLEMAAMHDRQAEMARQSADQLKDSDLFVMTAEGRCMRIPEPGAKSREAEFLDMAAFHARLAQKYRSMSQFSTPSDKNVLP